MTDVADNNTPTVLATARYGKDKIRLFRIVRDEMDPKWHTVVEYNVTALLEGDIDVSYTQADNSVIVATDSIKNITYYLAKLSPHILVPERFALHLAAFLVVKYAHIHKAFVKVEQLRWSRIRIPSAASGDDQGFNQHGHSFIRDGDEKRFASVEVDATKGKGALTATVKAGISDLLVLKSTNSSFTSYIQDAHTTLPEVSDRIFSTAIELEYAFAPFALEAKRRDGVNLSQELEIDIVVPQGDEASAHGSVWDVTVPERARNSTIEIFAEDVSASVQATLYKMAARILAENADVTSASYSLPNKHYIPVDMRYIGVENLAPSQAEVFVPIAAPSGLISATISRSLT